MTNKEKIEKIINDEITYLEGVLDQVKEDKTNFLEKRLEAQTDEDFEKYDHRVAENSSYQLLIEDEIKTLQVILKLSRED